MKINSFANEVLTALRANPDADACFLLSMGIGNSEAEIEFVMFQLKLFGYI